MIGGDRDRSGDRGCARRGRRLRCGGVARSAKPSVRGVSTEVIWEHADGGEDVIEIAEAFDLSPGDVRWALAYELPLRTG
jgi:uncharacterized protein (DUF433 family)